jgi:cytidylate kinase
MTVKDAACRIVTIDGPSGSGKGTISRAVASRSGRRW